MTSARTSTSGETRPRSADLYRRVVRDRVDHARVLHTRGGLSSATLALRTAADSAATSGPWSVVGRSFVPAGATANEYVHIAEYAWPDDSDPTGPWVIRDGQVNPAARSIASDGRLLARMADAVWTLALAGELFDRPGDTERAALLLHTWFVDPSTAMHPSLRHAVHVPGHDEPMTWGLARLHPLWQVVDALELLDGGHVDVVTDVDVTVAGVRQWFGQFLDWLVESELFAAELGRANNHSTHAMALALGLALAVGDDRAPELARRAEVVVGAQVGPDGEQPAELARSRSYFYCGYNLAAMLRVGELAWCCGVDLLAPTGAVRRALDALLPWLVDPRRWPKPSVEPSDSGRHGDLLVRAAAIWPGQTRIVAAARDSRIAPSRADRVWVETGVDPDELIGPRS